MLKNKYTKNLDDWNEYDCNIKEINRFLHEIYYDGFTTNCLENGKKIWGYPFSTFLKREEPVGSKLFLLPKEYELITLDELLLPPLSPPDFPIPIDEPRLRPNECEYPVLSKDSFKKIIEKRSILINQMNETKKLLEKKKNEFIELHLQLQTTLNKLKGQLKVSNPKENACLIEIAHSKHVIQKFLRNKFEVYIDINNRIALVQFKFPDYTEEDLVIGYTGKSKSKKLASESIKKKLVKQCLYSLIIRAAYLAAHYRQHNFYETVVVNVEQDWFDPATGQSRNGLIASLQAPVEYLGSLNLAKLDPESCFKYLKGIITPSLQNINPIRPIFVLNKNDSRIVTNKDIDSGLEPNSNLASLPWEDFEHLVAQLFEWEFARNGIEVKVTRVSRDRGVDAILYDPEPIKGGKYVLQAKRYTRTVDVSAVRDLYGTVLNEGANRGILITTSSYGPDAYEFAKDKPISLVDGQNLLLMFQKHGKKYHINLEEARVINKEFKDV